ncbi:amino acid ABC transporter permease [Specibacter sp. RAF43]|uniref:amino acid ABC transporter permease n=1 Tax=Specibacter sp. RAF43 TaxID=3233057 RepID=UPI003F955073
MPLDNHERTTIAERDRQPRPDYRSKDADLPVVERRHPWRTVGAVLAVAILAGVVLSLATNPAIDIGTIREYITAPAILRGVLITLFLTIIAFVLGFLGSLVLAVMRLSENRVLSTLASFYIWIFRGTPLLVQIIFWAYLGAIYPTLGLPIPFADILLWETKTSDLINPTIAALLALTFNELAYSAEIIRGGILSVQQGQTEAAKALGMPTGRTMRRIVLPQAMRAIIPPMGNQWIILLKSTALVSVIGGADLMTNVQYIYQSNFKVIPLLIVASIWYLLFVTISAWPQRWLERRYGRGASSRTA